LDLKLLFDFKAFVAIDKAKQNAEQNLKNAKELFESYLNRIYMHTLFPIQYTILKYWFSHYLEKN
jgi:Fe-S oxidoreductase